jgi:hypothetical protein
MTIPTKPGYCYQDNELPSFKGKIPKEEIHSFDYKRGLCLAGSSVSAVVLPVLHSIGDSVTKYGSSLDWTDRAYHVTSRRPL